MDRRQFSPTVILMIIVLAALTVFTVHTAVEGVSIREQVEIEKARTPTPEPAWGNVMLVTPDPYAPTPEPVLRSGTGGDEVNELQSRLQELGYYAGAVDGQYGPATKAAVMQFQRINHLDADGIVGSGTKSVLYSDQALPMPQVTTAPTAAATSPLAVSSAAVGLDENGMPLLVNKNQPIPDDFKPTELVYLAKYCDKTIVKIKASGIDGERVAVDALMEMLRAAVAEGITNWQVSAGYRSVKTQQQLFDNKVKELVDAGRKRSSAIASVKKTVAEPGTSEHHTGLAFDISVPGKSFKGTKQQKWLAAHCMEYGFVVRYTEDKERITGFLAEPWHIRYVGIEHAKKMTEQHLCLEEYIDRYGK